MPRVDLSELARLDRYPFVVVSWVDDDGYPSASRPISIPMPPAVR